MTFLTVPGIGNSGDGHWQTVWDQTLPGFQRVIQADWDEPHLEHWLARLEEAVLENGPDTQLVAHSLGCLLVAHWAARSKLPIRGAMLVAPPNPLASVFPREGAGFSDFPRVRLPFRSVVVASSNDPYADLDYSRACAAAWGSEFVCIGDAGHINGASLLGAWSEGQEVLRRLVEND